MFNRKSFHKNPKYFHPIKKEEILQIVEELVPPIETKKDTIEITTPIEESKVEETKPNRQKRKYVRKNTTSIK